MSKTGCVHRISPEDIKITDIPYISPTCFDASKIAKHYSNQSCEAVTTEEFDTRTVQVKQEGDRIYALCRYHQYRLNNGDLIDCPDRVFDLSYNTNLTIEKHQSRPDAGPLLTYFGTIQEKRAKTRFNVPDNLKMVEPPLSGAIKLLPPLREVRSNVTDIYEQIRRKAPAMTRLGEAEREARTQWQTILLFVVVGLAVVLIFLAFIYLFMKHKKRRATPTRITYAAAPKESTQVEIPPAYDERGPVIRIVPSRRAYYDTEPYNNYQY